MKDTKHLTDQTILGAILGSQLEREQVFGYLYLHSGWKEKAVKFVVLEGGDSSTGEDIFQEALILLDRNIRENKFQNHSSLQTYFMGIVRQYWFNQQRKKRPMALSPEMKQLDEQDLEREVLRKEREHIIQVVMQTIGDHCKKVLSLYKLSLSNEEIARELGLSSPEMAKKYTYRCREKFKAFIEKHPVIKELLYVE